MESGLTIAVDVDDTIAALIPAWLDVYNREYRDKLRPGDITDWDIAKFTRAGTKFYAYLTCELYDKVVPIQGALDGVNRLRALGHRVIFVTSTPQGCEGAKLAWLKRQLFLDPLGAYGDGRIYDDYLEVHDKSLVRADILVDDRLENIVNFPGTGILFTQPHNASASVTRRADNWEEVVAWIEPPESIEMAGITSRYAGAINISVVPATSIKTTPGENWWVGGKDSSAGGVVSDPERSADWRPSSPQDVPHAGVKYDNGKARMDLVPPLPLRELGELYAFGANKYADRNWEKGMAWGRMYGALLRHALAFWNGEDFDPEHKLSHLSSVAFCAFALREYMVTHPELDDRPNDNSSN